MSRRVLLGEVTQLPPGEGRTFAVNGLRLAVFHLRSGNIFATQADCPHLGGPLADGMTGGTTVICPLHDRVFDLRTGEGLQGECLSLKVYPVALADDGKIWLQMPD